MTQEKIVEIKHCKLCSVDFEITDRDLEFYDKISPIFNSKKFNIPTPTFCPDCRMKRRFAFRNERKLYKRKCDITGKDIISMYAPWTKYKIFDTDYWWSDNWNPLDYWQDINFDIDFFTQINDLLHKVPLASILNTNTQNAQFNNFIYEAKNCYMSFVVYYDSENIFYSSWIFGSKNIFDCFIIRSSENCYSSTDLTGCYNCFYTILCNSSSNCYYSRNLRWCSFCIWCSNLTNKKYCIKNVQYTKEEYDKKLKDIQIFDNNTEFINFIKKEPYLYTNSINTIDSSWDYLKDCKNCKYSFDSADSEDTKYVISEITSNSYDWMWWSLEYSYEYMRVWFWQKIFFSNDVIESENIYYSFSLFACKNCFWCVWLRNKEYFILNKQYSKEEYNKIVPKIIKNMSRETNALGEQKVKQWWEFFPANMSQFWYNETVAQEYFPLSKTEALDLDFNWCDYIQAFPKVEKIIPASKLPSNIENIPDDILNWAIECEELKKPFKIIKQELEFYRKYNLPIPKKHPDERHSERLLSRNPRKLFERKCDKCFKDLKSTFSWDRKETVYCQECYDKYVY